MAKIESKSFVAQKAGYSMKSLVVNRQSWIGTFRKAFVLRLTRCSAVAVMLLVLGWSYDAAAQSDNFDDGDDAGWSKVTSPNYLATYSFPTDEFGGHAYRLQGATPAPVAGGQSDPMTARVIAYRSDRLYTNFFVAADIVAWDSSTTNDQVFGLIARANNIDSGLVDGVTFTVRINRFANTEGSKGQVQIYGFNGGAVGAPAAQNIFTVLVPGRKYRFVFSGVGNFYTGAVYDLEDLTKPLVTMSGDDTYASFFGVPYPSSGYCGILNVSLASGSKDPTTDSTFDNFVAAESPPTSVSAPATPHGLVGAPQVVNRSPASFANFYPAASGITFNATTLTSTNTINTNALKLFLNGLDVSSALSISGPATNLSVSYSGLASNAVYDARIELQDALGRRTTNAWTFDTFSDNYLESPVSKNIECEDYDFEDGDFIDPPLASGYRTDGTGPLNSNVGYVDKVGTAGVDFFDRRTGPEIGAYANYAMFRPMDAVGTEQGKVNYLYVDNFTATLDYSVNRTYDTQRQKYFVEDPALQEYEVVQTTGEEWLNYTRAFSSSNYYNVYLRYACGYSQQVSLDEIGAGPATNNIGIFSASNDLTLNHFRYAPLLDEVGKLAVVNLSGTNTLRLTVLGADINPTKFALALNYMALVPALLVESAPQVTGPYTLETGASVDPGNRLVTIPQNGAARFYRLRWDRAVNITSVRLTGGNVELKYQ